MEEIIALLCVVCCSSMRRKTTSAAGDGRFAFAPDQIPGAQWWWLENAKRYMVFWE